jgi:hypothetical protein
MPRFVAECFQHPQYIHTLNHACTIVVGAMTHIPAVEVAAHQDHIIGAFGAPDFSNNVKGGLVWKGLAVQLYGNL